MSTPTADRPQFLLPFAEKEWITVDRAERILGVDTGVIYRLRELRDQQGQPYLSVVDYGRGNRKRVLYSSVVRYCDYLRRRYAIRDRRPPLDHPIFRHRDEDLLPFPLSDTIDTRAALAYTAYDSTFSIHKRIEEGAFEAYQILPLRGSPWRISRSSFARWISQSLEGRTK